MNATIISIGTELTSGQTIDTNSAYLARQLAQWGIETVRHVTVTDDLAPIVEAIRDAVAHADLVLITGGLGPTADDLTRDALAQVLGTQLVLDEKCLADLEAFFQRLGRPMVPSNRIQAMIPQGCEVLENLVGTAAGLAARIGSAQIYVTPGVPHEMRWIFEHIIAPRLSRQGGVILHRIVHTFGAGESDIGEKIADLMIRGANPTVGTTVAAGMVSVRIIARAADMTAATRMADDVATQVRARLGKLVVGQEHQTMASVLGELLRGKNQTLATAESCTGGMIGQMITAIAGSSDYYRGGVVAYSNEIKSGVLGVSDDLLREHGAVSEPVAIAMADACRARLGSDWAISVTGIAGPGGGTPTKPVGLVYIGLAGPGKGARAFRHVFPGERDIVRLRASLAAMNYLRLELLET